MPDFVQALEPPYFTEAIALACDLNPWDFQLGHTKIFLRPGKGTFLEELKDRDLSEVIPLLTAKNKEWEVRKAAKLKVALATQRYFHRRDFLLSRLQHTRELSLVGKPRPAPPLCPKE